MLRNHRLSAAVALPILAAVAIGSAGLIVAQQRDVSARLDLAATSIAMEFQTEVTRLLDLGHDLGIALELTPDLDHEAYAELLDTFALSERFPALVGVGYVDIVDRAALPAWLAERQAEGDGFELRDDAGEPRLHIIRYHGPLPTNAAAVGLDITGRGETQDAVDLVLATGQPQLSRATRIAQLPEDEPGSVLHVPRSDDTGRIVGTLSLVLSGPGLLAGLEPLPADLRITVRDPGSATFPEVGRLGRAASNRYGALEAQRDIGLEPATWLLEVRPGASFDPAMSRQPSVLLGLTGLLVALLAGAVVYSLGSRERLAQAIAEERTRQLADANEQLRVANDRLSASNTELREAHRAKDGFLAAVSHELRTPLTVIAGFTEALRRLPEPTPPDELLTPLERNVRRLDTLVGDLLVLAGLDAGALTAFREEVNLADCIAHTALDLAWLEQVEIDVEVAADLDVEVDPRHLDRMLANLVVNALRHGRPPVELQASASDDEVVLRVRDHGDGVPADEVARLFGRFERGRSTDRVTGTGLGLAIVAELAALNRGSVAYEPAEPGACFVLRLPRARTDRRSDDPMRLARRADRHRTATGPGTGTDRPGR